MFKPIAIGTEIFHELIESNSYYVDKTPFISTVFEKNTSKVMLITRPRLRKINIRISAVNVWGSFR